MTICGILGNTLEEIATQKAGIIKPNSETIFVSQNDISDQVIEFTCKAKNNKIHKILLSDIENYSYDKDFQKFDYKNYKNVYINLKGKIQISNASIALECINIIKEKGFNINETLLKVGLKTVVHKARFEKICDTPLIVYDGCHNEDSVQSLINMVDMYYKNSSKTFIVSILKTKDFNTIFKELSIYKDSTFIFTSGNENKNFVSKEELLDTFKKYSNNSNLLALDLQDAIDYVFSSNNSDVNFIIGSFYIYGDVLNEIKKLKHQKTL